jgi:hypothetical protein
MANSTLANLAAATPATGGLFYGTQAGSDKKFTFTAAGAALIEAATASAQAVLLPVLPLTGGTLTGTVTGTTFVGALTGTASGNLVAGGALGTPSSGNASNLTNIPAGNLTGTIDTARLPATITGLTSVTSTTFVGALTGTASGNLVAGGALGTPSSGALTNCTSIPAGQLTGTIDTARLPATITGLTSVTSTTFVGALTGTASGNLVAGGALGTPASGTLTNCTIPASSITTGTVATARLGSGTASATTYLRGDSTFVALPTEIQVACSDETTALTLGVKVTFRMPYGMTLTSVRASLTTAPTGSAVIINVKESGTTVLSSLLNIAIGSKTSTTTSISDSALADDAEMTIEITQIGGVAAGLKVTLIGTRA